MRPARALPLLLAFAGIAAYAEDDALVWLDRMSKAVDQLTYTGTFVHIAGDEVETMRVIHRVADGQVNERLVSMDGSGREVVRTAEETRCILQAERAVLIDRREGQSPLRVALPADPSELDRYYTFAYLGPDRVAERDTRIIEVRPKDRYRYGFKLWLDEETAMPLRSIVTAEQGRAVERVHFTDISFPASISDDELEPDIAIEGFTRHVSNAEGDPVNESETARWEAGDLPDGFSLTVSRSEASDGGVGGEEHLVYTDGLASVSVFMKPLAAGGKPSRGFAALGGSNAFSTTVEDYQVTVVGEVPADTLRMIAESMRRSLERSQR